MQYIKLFYKYIKSKFNPIQWAVLGLLIFYAFFISEDTIFDRIAYNHQISNLKDEITYYKNMKYNDSIKIEALKIDKKQIEKFGREKYLMKKSGEDLFIIKD